MVNQGLQEPFTIEFEGRGLEVRPISIDFRRDSMQYDYCRAEFTSETGEALYWETKLTSLGNRQRAFLKIDGERVATMFYTPENIVYGETQSYLELVDLHHYLEQFTIDDEYASITAREAYEDIFSRLPDDTTVFGDSPTVSDNIYYNIPDYTAMQGAEDLANDDSEGGESLQERFFNSPTNLDFDGISIREAIERANETFGLNTWIDRDGEIHVGRRDFRPTNHITAFDDHRTLQLIDAELRQPSVPVTELVVEGWVISPATVDTGEQAEIENSVEEFANWLGDQWEGNNNSGIRVEGVARITSEERTNSLDTTVDFGNVPEDVRQRAIDANGGELPSDRDNLENFTRLFRTAPTAHENLARVAEFLLRNNISHRRSGSVTLSPNLSSDEITDFRNLRVGDLMTVVPPEEDHCFFDYNSVVEQYTISGFKHRAEEREWKLDVDLIYFADEDIETEVRYIDRSSGEEVNSDYINNNLLDSYTDYSPDFVDFVSPNGGAVADLAFDVVGEAVDDFLD